MSQPISLPDAASLVREEERIRAAYARRQGLKHYTWFDPAYAWMSQERGRECLRLLARHGCADSWASRRILEVGCGNGDWLRDFIQWGARPENLTGIDLLPHRVAESRQRCPAATTVESGSAAELRFPDASFDMVLQATLFSSILEAAVRRQVAREMLRVLKPGGFILWYDYHVNNPWNREVRGVKKREIRELFSGCAVELRRVTLAPSITRRIARYSLLLCHVLDHLRFLQTHYLGIIRKEPARVETSV